MNITKKQYYNYLIDCSGYSEQELNEIYQADGLSGLSDLIADENGILEYSN